MLKIMTRADKILILFILVSSITGIFAIPKLLSNANSAKQVVVSVAGEEIARFALINTPESEFKEVPFRVNEKEYTARFEMKNGKVMLHRLPEDIVPLGIHRDMGWISESYQMIVALPVKMHVTVESDTSPEDGAPDIIIH
ncbi:MAG TPA: NusG domain II-containing protein [Clostridia bacterium]|nr:NusG domain II-containing protein [Clostridia bacterium]